MLFDAIQNCHMGESKDSVVPRLPHRSNLWGFGGFSFVSRHGDSIILRNPRILDRIRRHWDLPCTDKGERFVVSLVLLYCSGRPHGLELWPVSDFIHFVLALYDPNISCDSGVLPVLLPVPLLGLNSSPFALSHLLTSAVPSKRETLQNND